MIILLSILKEFSISQWQLTLGRLFISPDNRILDYPLSFTPLPLVNFSSPPSKQYFSHFGDLWSFILIASICKFFQNIPVFPFPFYWCYLVESSDPTLTYKMYELSSINILVLIGLLIWTDLWYPSLIQGTQHVIGGSGFFYSPWEVERPTILNFERDITHIPKRLYA